MWARIGAKIAGWSAGHSSTAWLLVGLLSFAGVAYGYVQHLRVKAARCEATLEIQQRVEALAAEIKKRRNEDLGDLQEAIRDIEDSCLDQPDPTLQLRDR